MGRYWGGVWWNGAQPCVRKGGKEGRNFNPVRSWVLRSWKQRTSPKKSSQAWVASPLWEEYSEEAKETLHSQSKRWGTLGDFQVPDIEGRPPPFVKDSSQPGIEKPVGRRWVPRQKQAWTGNSAVCNSPCGLPLQSMSSQAKLNSHKQVHTCRRQVTPPPHTHSIYVCVQGKHLSTEINHKSYTNGCAPTPSLETWSKEKYFQ